MTVISVARPSPSTWRSGRRVLGPQHGEVRGGHLVGGRQVDPDLEQLERVRGVLVEQREHLGVDDAAAGRQPLGVAAPEAGGRAERVGVVDQATAHVGDRLEAAVGMAGEPGHVPTVVHPPAVDAGEVLAELAPGEDGLGPAWPSPAG